jgi:hypothetical protein
MRTAIKLTLLPLLTALTCATPAAADDQTVPCQVVAEQKPCPADPQAEARWARKRLRELDEQAETARLNREFNNAPPPLPPSAPPPRQAANLPIPPTMAPAPAQYRSALEEYQALRESYDRQLRAYYRAFPAQASSRTVAPAPGSLPSPAEFAAQDAARADVWHGYNRHDGPGNGY